MCHFISFPLPRFCWLLMSIVQLVLGLMQIQINSWNPITIILYASWYKNSRSRHACFGGLILNSSTHSGSLAVTVKCCNFFSFKKQPTVIIPMHYIFRYFLPFWSQYIQELYRVNCGKEHSCHHPILFSA